MSTRSEKPGITRQLASGMTAEVAPDPFRDGAFQLVVDGTPQSEVDLEAPDNLVFEYTARIGGVIDQIAPPGAPVSAIHLGGGALTLPRYVAETRPGSRQQVIEYDAALLDFVREQLPWSKKAAIRVRIGDARSTLDRLPPALRGGADLAVVDVFSGSAIPSHVTTAEFYESLATWMAPEGVVCVNVTDGGSLAFARSQAATLLHVFGTGMLLTEAGVAKGRRFGNVVLVAAKAPGQAFSDAGLQSIRRAGPHPAAVMVGGELARFAKAGRIVTDASPMPSPHPPSGMFQ